jgi:hypothetical protein
MYDQPLFLQTLSRFAAVLPVRYDLEAVLTELMESATAVLGLWGSGVTMADDDRLRYVTAEIQASGQLERIQEWQQAGASRLNGTAPSSRSACGVYPRLHPRLVG